jgi:hypothetical protein
MSENTIKLKEIIDSYFNQEFLLRMIDETDNDDVYKFLSSYKNKEFYDEKGNLLSIEDGVFLNPTFKDIIENTMNTEEDDSDKAVK